jgi:hypothetical protein
VVELRNATNLNKTPRLKQDSRFVLEGAHGEEVVRSLFVDEAVSQFLYAQGDLLIATKTGMIFTAGEDGHIKSFRAQDNTNQTPATYKTSKSKRASESRYKPY